jgi:hypothetical protein
MACAVKVQLFTLVSRMPVLNTIDKGYSVIITMPNKMSLVSLLSTCVVHANVVADSRV